MRVKKIMVSLLVLAVLAAVSPSISLATPVCPSHNSVYPIPYGFNADRQLVHNYECFDCGEVISTELCVFDPNPVPGVDGCLLCFGAYSVACPPNGHNFTPWAIDQVADGSFTHSRYCQSCTMLEGIVSDEPCTYDGGTVCIVCGWDAKTCMTCKGEYTLKCGDNADCAHYYENTRYTCPSYTWWVSDIGERIGYCGCGCEVVEFAEIWIEQIKSGGGFPEPDMDHMYIQCSDAGNCSCSCSWDCPDCEAPQQSPKTTPTAPKTGEDLSAFLWGMGGAAVGLVVCFVAILLMRRARCPHRAAER